MSATMPSNSRSAESSNTVPSGAMRRTSSLSGISMTSERSETSVRGQSAVPVTQTILDPMRRAMLAVCTTEDVLPVKDIRMVRSSLPIIGVVISPTKCTSSPSWTRRTANIWPTRPERPDP